MKEYIETVIKMFMVAVLFVGIMTNARSEEVQEVKSAKELTEDHNKEETDEERTQKLNEYLNDTVEVEDDN